MVFLQALISFVGRSAGKLLNAIFGWAVVALFGRRSPRQQTMLSGVVAMAAAWPLLLLGIAFPRIATFLLAFIPLAKSASSGLIRAIWLALALLVPIVVGLVVAAQGTSRRRGSFGARLLQGFPVTLGLASAFLLMFLTVPVLRLLSALRGRTDEHVPLITEGDEYLRVAEKIERLIRTFGIDATRAKAPWWATTPATILETLGRGAFRSYVPGDLAFWQGRTIQITLYPSDVLIRGERKRAAWTHAVLAESFARGPGVQSFNPDAQRIERQAQRIWRLVEENPEAHRGSKILTGRLEDLVRDLAALDLPYEQWEVVYRELAQLGRAIDGRPQLISSATTKEDEMSDRSRYGTESYEEEEFGEARSPLESAPTGRILSDFLKQITQLLKKEIELARAEVKAMVGRVVGMVVGFVVAGFLMLLGLGFLLTSLVLGLAHVMAPWLAALIVGAVTLAVGGIMIATAKSKGIGKPFERTQRTLKEDVRWARERLA